MKKYKNKTIFVISFLLVLISSLALQMVHSRSAEKSLHNSYYCMNFIKAEYLDADSDGLEDDTRFSVELTFDSTVFDGRTIKLNCDFVIITPSLSTFNYSGFIITNCVDSIFIFDVYNTITEPGWYTIDFHSNFQYKGLIYSSFCTIIFDPPETAKPEGGGAPGIGF